MEEAAVCTVCGSIGFDSGGDGRFYCRACGFQSQDLMEEAIEEHDYDHTVDRRYVVRAPESQQEPDSQFTQRLQMLASLQRLTQPDASVSEEDHPTNPSLFSNQVHPLDFPPSASQSQQPPAPVANEVEVAEQLRTVYLEGLQVMLQMQCEALVVKFGVSPLICGIVAPIWLRFVTSSSILDDGWHSQAKLEEDTAAAEGPKCSVKYMKSSRYKADLRTESGKKTLHVWIRALKRKIPLSSSLSICFLACHISREAILPTDIVRWAVEAEIPYLSAFINIEKHLSSFSIRSVNSSLLFRPTQVVDSWQLESSAGLIAEHIGLHLPPVNFFSIANRYLKELPVVIDKVLPCACHIYEWSMPPDLWIPSHHSRLPSRVCVMSILVLAIRLVYNIGGHFYWERSLGIQMNKYHKRKSKEKDASFPSDNMEASHAAEVSGTPYAVDSALGDCSKTPKLKAPVKKLLHSSCSESDSVDLLHNIDTAHRSATSGHDYSTDLQSYLEYCKDIIFAAKTTTFDEESLISYLWKQFKIKEEMTDPLENMESRCTGSIPSVVHKTYHIEAVDGTTEGVELCNPRRGKRKKNDIQNSSKAHSRKRALKSIQSDMEKHGFLYTISRHRDTTSKYLHYKRTSMHGKLRYMVHADYYILLQTCARIVEVDARILHLGLLKLERRLHWIEKRIDCSLPSVFRCAKQ